MPDFQYTKPSILNNNFSPQVIVTPLGTTVSTSFVFASVDFQNQANTIYQAKKQYETANNASVTGKRFQFASQQDRIAALIGQYNQNPNS